MDIASLSAISGIENISKYMISQRLQFFFYSRICSSFVMILKVLDIFK